MDEHTRNHLLKRPPLENVKTRMQTHNFKNVSECVQYLWRTEGPRGFVAGALPPLVSVTTVRVMNFTTYNAAKQKISALFERVTGVSPAKEYNKPDSSPSIKALVTFTSAGMMAGLVTSPLACPFELAKNVVQTSVLVSNRALASPDAARDPSLRNRPRLGTIEAIRQIVRRHGFLGLYTGFRLHAMRDTIGSGLYFSIYETCKQETAKRLGTDEKSPVGAPALAGAVCSTVPWICTYPLDTRKTRAQSVLLGKTKEVGEASVAVAQSSMYKGVSIILLRTGVNNMILLSLYEYLRSKIQQLPE